MALTKEDLQAIRELVREEVTAETSPIKADITELKTDMVGMKADMVDMKADMVDMKADMVDMKADMVDMKTDMVGMKADITELKTDMVDMKADISVLKVKVTGLEEGLQSVRDFQVIVENEWFRKIDVALDEVIDWNRKNKDQEKRISVVENKVETHSIRIGSLERIAK